MGTMEGKMGFHYTAKPIWGDTPAEILQEAFHKIKEAFKDEQGREVKKSDLILGCHFGIDAFFSENIDRSVQVNGGANNSVIVTGNGNKF